MTRIKKWLDNFLKRKTKQDQPIKKSSEPNNKDDKENTKPKGLFIRKKRRPNFFLSVFVTTLRLFLILFILLGFVGFGAVVGVGKAYLDSTPELDVVQIQDQSETTFIYDKYGNLITEYYGYENQFGLPLTRSQKFKNAFITIEDAL